MSHPEKDNVKKIGITIGDFNGIGPEVIIKAFSDNRMMQSCTPVIYGSSKVISFYRKLMNNAEFSFNTIKGVEQAASRKLNLINCWEEDVKIEPGQASEAAGKYAFKSLESAVSDLASGKLDALVTAPINKDVMNASGFSFPGHTEYLADVFHAKDHLMFLISDALKVAVVSGHVSLRKASEELTKEKILSKIKLINKSLLEDFGLRKARIAVLGLNPHAGDNGVIGNEEKEIIIPAVQQAFQQGIMAFGPYAADGFFGSGQFRHFDAVLAMYHDQGLVPFKTLTFDEGVNFTAGLPVVRTSPDHGTAYDIAGKNEASETSLRQAVYKATDIIQKREEYHIISSNPLPMGFSKLSRDQ